MPVTRSHRGRKKGSKDSGSSGRKTHSKLPPPIYSAGNPQPLKTAMSTSATYNPNLGYTSIDWYHFHQSSQQPAAGSHSKAVDPKKPSLPVRIRSNVSKSAKANTFESFEQTEFPHIIFKSPSTKPSSVVIGNGNNLFDSMVSQKSSSGPSDMVKGAAQKEARVNVSNSSNIFLGGASPNFIYGLENFTPIQNPLNVCRPFDQRKLPHITNCQLGITMVEGTARPYKCRGCTRRYKFDYGVVSHLQQCDQWKKLYYSQFASEPCPKLNLPVRPITSAPASSPLSPSFSSPSRNVKLGSDDDDDIRCICLDNLTPYGRPVNPNGPMVQCDMCDKWLHLECLGLTEDELPDLWHCGFCSGKYTLLSCGLVNRSDGSQSKTPPVDGEFDDTSSDMTEVADFDEKDEDDEKIVTLSKRLCKRPSSISDTPPLLPTPQSDNQMKPYQRPQIHLTKSHSFCGSPSKGANYETTAPSINSTASTSTSHLLTQQLGNSNVFQMPQPQLSRTVSDCVISSLQDARKRKRSKVPIPVRLKMRANSMSSIPAAPSSSVSFNSRNYVPPPSPSKSLTISSTQTPPKSNLVLQYPAQGFPSASPQNTPKLKLVIKSSNLATILEKDVKSSDLRRYIPQNETRSESSSITSGKVHIQSQQSSALTTSKGNTPLGRKKDGFVVSFKGQQSSVKEIAEGDSAALTSSEKQNEIEDDSFNSSSSSFSLADSLSMFNNGAFNSEIASSLELTGSSNSSNLSNSHSYSFNDLQLPMNGSFENVFGETPFQFVPPNEFSSPQYSQTGQIALPDLNTSLSSVADDESAFDLINMSLLDMDMEFNMNLEVAHVSPTNDGMSMKPTCFSSVFLPTPISSNSPSPAPPDGMPYSAQTMNDLPDSSILNQYLNSTFTSTVPMQGSVKCHELKFQANDRKPEIATLPQNDQQFAEVLNGNQEEKSAEDVDFEKEMAGLIDMTQVC